MYHDPIHPKISFDHAPRLKMTLILILFIALVRVVVAGVN
jgi:hypothetical protein